jgi:hypothetical protein
MESLMGTQSTNEEQSKFVLEHIYEISNAWQLLVDSLKQSHELITASYQSHSKLKLKYNRHNWFQPLPAYQYYSEDSNCQVISFASPTAMDNDKTGNNEANIGKYFFMQMSVSKGKNPNLYQAIFNRLKEKVVNNWSDMKSGTLRWPVENLSASAIANEVIKTLQAVQKIESSFIQEEITYKKVLHET